MKRTILLIPFLLLCSALSAQQTDSTLANRNIMLNASSSTKPREISIGLPSSFGGTEIFEDGLPVGYYFWPVSHDNHWRGGESYGATSTMSLGENAIRSGNVGYAVNSFTRLGGDRFRASAAFKTDQFGLLRGDVNLSGPIARGFYYTAGAYGDFNPGYSKIPFMHFAEQTQIYKAGLTKRWDRGEVSLLAKKYLGNTGQFTGSSPFYYEGDGTITPLEGFRLGRDNYVPGEGWFNYLEQTTGEMHRQDLSKANKRGGYDLMLRAALDLGDGMKLNLMSRVGQGHIGRMMYSASGIDDLTAAAGYTFADGSPFAGLVQSRSLMFYRGESADFCTTVEFTRETERHHWRVGYDEWHNRQAVNSATASMAHTVEKDPVSLYKDGQISWNFNATSEYDYGKERKHALFATHEWAPSPAFKLYYGVRLELFYMSVNAAFANHGNPANNRHAGFTLKDPGVTIDNYHALKVNPSATVNTVYRFTRHAGLAADYLFVRQNMRLEHFSHGFPASLAPQDVHLGRFGLTYDLPWLNLTSMVSYIYKTNNKSQTRFFKTVNSVNEVQTRLMIHDIATLGWTTDAVVKPTSRFNIHLLLTLQKPEYRKYTTTLTFSDGIPQTYDYSGKIVKSVPRILAEIDPSYTTAKWRFWASARYYGKQFANMPNNVYFNGHWETFGGIDYHAGEHVTLLLNLVNILNQRGASGSVAAADLMTDTSALRHILIAGSCIRPFTTELTLRVSF